VSFIDREALPYLSYIVVYIVGILRYRFGYSLVVSNSRSLDDIAVVSLLVIS
jgi:hypothetical protein